MLSTMQDYQLTVASVMRHAGTVHTDRTIISAVTPETMRRTTYGQLAERAGQLANGLQSLGITGDQRVGTFLWNGQEHMDAYLAVPSMGAVLHTLNLRLTPEHLSYIANHSEDQVIIADDSVVPLLARALPDMDTVHTVVVVGDGDASALDAAGKQVIRFDDLLGSHDTEFSWPTVSETDAAALCYTSGTTGNPKGVVYSHRSMWLHSQAACTRNALGVGYDDKILAIVPMFHANAWGLPYAALMAGAELLMPGRFLQAEPLVKMIESERPTMSGAVPTIWNDILHYLREHPGHDLSSLKFVACGGSAVPPSLMEAFDKLGVRIVQAWGMTETSPLAAVALPPVNLPAEDQTRLRATQGRVVAGVDARIVDDAGDEMVMDGASVGELEVRGPWVTGAYYRGEDPDKFHDGWLRTGDVGRLDRGGFITLTDRAKDVIKSGGEWISSVELENTLIGHENVLQAAVIAVPDDRWQERPLAAVVLRPGVTTTARQLHEYLHGKVAKWWLPERWAFIEAVPLTGTGKYDKKVLRRQYAAGELKVEELDRSG